MTKVLPEEPTCLPDVPIEGVPDEAAHKKRRATHAAIVADLPSTFIQRSPQGTSLSRKNMTDNRVKRLQQPGGPNQRPKSAGAMELRLWQDAQRRGLSIDMDNDDDIDELDKLKQLEIVREMPVPIAEKRKLRQSLYEKIGEYEESRCSAYCHRRNSIMYKKRMKGKRQLREIGQYLTLWRGAFGHIEGVQGAGVLTYFSFLKWLFLVNSFIFSVIFFFLVLPQVAFPVQPYSTWVVSNTSNPEVALTDVCSANYTASIVVSTDPFRLILNFIEGSGWMEKTAMFYGFYQDRLVSSTGSTYGYNIPLAYTSVMFFYVIFSLMVIVRQTTNGFKSRLFNTQKAGRQFCNIVFGALDSSLKNEKTAELKRKTFYRQIIGSLEEIRLLRRMKERTTGQKAKLYFIRVLINCLIAASLGGAGYLIYFTTVKTLEISSSADYANQHVIIKFLTQYMTSLTITALNGILPTLFKKIVKFEDYSTGFEVSMTLFRTVFLKLASVAILLGSIYSKITCAPQDTCRVGTGTCTSLRCWETYVGQEIYKLVIMDFIVLVGMTFAVEFPRMLVVTKCNCRLAKMIGRQEFDISKEVLNLIYGETLFWLGAFFAPLIPAVVVIKNLLTFYIKYLTTIVNYGPSTKPYSASDSHAFFMYVLLASYTMCVFPVAYCVWMVPPSRGCGPFRLYDHMYGIITLTITTFPTWLRSIINFAQSAAFQIPLVVILCLGIYYSAQIASAYKDMTKLLKEQLVVDTHDKRHLMEKIQELSGNPKSPPKKAIYKDDKLGTDQPIAHQPEGENGVMDLAMPPGVPMV